MPTGYTYGVQEGKVTTLEDYAKTCARAFLWQSRDSNEQDLLKLISDEKTVEYYVKSLAEAEALLFKLDALDEDGWRKLYDDEHKELKAFEDGYNARKELERNRYTEMLEKVQAWTPPTVTHHDLKKFMVEQLESSIKFDCSDTNWVSSATPFDAWRKQKHNTAATDVIKRRADLDRQVSRQTDFINWVNDLLDSVKGK